MAYQIAKEEVEKLVKPVAERIAKRLCARILVALAVPGANIIVGIALAVEITLELYLVAMELKVLMETLELQTRKRTAEDLRCRCKDTPTAPECACSKEAYPHRRIRVIPPISLYDVRVDVHHTCADASGNSYGGRDVRMDSPTAGSISVDLFSEPTMLACEVKISFKSQPYDPYILNRWLATTITQLTRQQNIAETCG